MRFVRVAAALLAGALALGVTLPAQAATKAISIVNTSVGFDPDPVAGAEGTTFSWTNNDGLTHTSTQDSPLSLWTTGNVPPGATKSVTIASAGGYPYHCAIHPFMTGTVRVPIRVGPSSGTTSTTTFTITMATTDATGSFVYDVQERAGAGAWTNYMTGVTAKSVTFKPSTTGTFSFRSRLRNKAVANATSAWSPRKTVTVS
jgi:plastocyanin